MVTNGLLYHKSDMNAVYKYEPLVIFIIAPGGCLAMSRRLPEPAPRQCLLQLLAEKYQALTFEEALQRGKEWTIVYRYLLLIHFHLRIVVPVVSKGGGGGDGE